MEVPKICHECQSGIPEDSRFCMECGKKFDITCSGCVKNVPPDSKFCFDCCNDLRLANRWCVGV